MNSAYYASYVVQALGALLTAVIFRALGRTYVRRFLQEWSLAWLALGISYAASAGAAARAFGSPPLDPLRIVLSLAASVSGYVHLALLVIGGLGLAGPGLSRNARRYAIGGAAAVGALVILPFAADPEGATLRFLIRVGVRELVTATAFAVVAAIIWRATPAAQRKLGRKIACGSLLAYGVVHLHGFALTVVQVTTGTRFEYAIYVGFMSFLLGVVASLGVVIWMLEDERRGAREYAARAEEIALRDPLTGLPNRKRFFGLVRQAVLKARIDKQRFAVFFLDLDRFKLINDTLGHATGDRLLHAVSLRVRTALRAEDTIARLGGDEFTVLTGTVRDRDHAADLAGAVRNAIREPLYLDGRELYVSTSVGVSVYPDDATDADAIVRQADLAMYRAKAEGRDIVRFYDPELNTTAHEQLAIESALHHAVGDRQLSLHWQPIVGVDGTVRAVEALLRWHHPTLGPIHAARFLGMAETTGMIVELGEWVRGAALRALTSWRAEHPDLRVTVNVSAREMREPGFVAGVERMLHDFRLPGGALELEIAEHAVAESTEAVTQAAAELRALGVRVTVDGYGTGGMSLQTLWGFPCDALKTGRALLRGEEGTGESLLGLAAAVAVARGVELVVAGVELPEELALVRRYKVAAWQGTLHSMPGPAEEVFRAPAGLAAPRPAEHATS